MNCLRGLASARWIGASRSSRSNLRSSPRGRRAAGVVADQHDDGDGDKVRGVDHAEPKGNGQGLPRCDVQPVQYQPSAQVEQELEGEIATQEIEQGMRSVGSSWSRVQFNTEQR